MIAGIEAGAIRLGEAHLNDNDLSMAELAELNAVIKASAPDLKILDLQDNKLSVNSPEDMAIWLDFLQSLSCCRELQTLRLSHNPLGDKAIELMARAYCRSESQSTSNLATDMQPSFPEKDGLLEETAEPVILVDGIQKSDEGYSGSETRRESVEFAARPTSPGLCRPGTYQLTTDTLYKPAGGLRNVTELALEDVRLSDAGALSLSYVIEHCYQDRECSVLEHLPEHSRINLRALPNDRSDHVATPRTGVRHNGNDFSGPGSKLLEIAERSAEPTSDYGSMVSANSPARRRSSTCAGLPFPERRRSSAGSDGDSKFAVTVPNTTELERARTKVQGLLLKDNAITSLPVELWRISLSILRVARVIRTMNPQENLGGLSIALWQQIVVEACDEHHLLSETQSANIMRWARDVDCMQIEQEWDNKLPHVRTWRILEAIGCLAYDC